MAEINLDWSARERPTAKQLDFIDGLRERLGLMPLSAAELKELDREGASEMIEELLEDASWDATSDWEWGDKYV